MRKSNHTTSIVLDALRRHGVDTSSTELVATVALLPAGSRRHYTGLRVQVFCPVALAMEFMQPGLDRPVMATRFGADHVVRRDEESPQIDPHSFDAQVRIEGLPSEEHSAELVAGLGLLMRELVSSHREITGRINQAHEHIEVDPATIGKIVAKRFQLSIGLERLVEYLALDDEWLDLLIDGHGPEAEVRRAQIAYAKLMLRDEFIKQPATPELYEELVTEFRASSYAKGMEFLDYYLWFRNSETMFEKDGSMTSQTREDMAGAISSWCNSFGTDEEGRKRTTYWANRNFKIHPRHRPAVDKFIEEVANAAPHRSPSPSCRG